MSHAARFTSFVRRPTRFAAGLMSVAAVAAAAAFVTPVSAQAIAQPAPPREVVALSSSATIEVPRDLMTVVFGITRDGLDAAQVQSQLKQALDAALAEARRAAKPGQVDVRTGSFNLSPRYAQQGSISGWQGRAELIVEGRDLAAIGQLSGRITTLTVQSVGYGLSRELRERSEGEVAGQAIARFRAKAADYAKQFGYAGYVLGEVSVSSVDAQPPMPRMAMMRAAPMSTKSADELPSEAGNGTVTVSVGGSVQLTR